MNSKEFLEAEYAEYKKQAEAKIAELEKNIETLSNRELELTIIINNIQNDNDKLVEANKKQLEDAYILVGKTVDRLLN